jgi:hypothetical protein
VPFVDDGVLIARNPDFTRRKPGFWEAIASVHMHR